MTPAFAELPGARVLQYHNITPAHFFAGYDANLFRLATLGRKDLATLVGHVDLALGDSDFNRQELEEMGFSPTGVMPIALDLVAHHRRAAPARARKNPGRRPDKLPVRRTHRAQQEDRGPYPSGGALQALRRRVLPFHLRGQDRRGAALLRHRPRVDVRIPDARGPLPLRRPRAERGPGGVYRYADVYISLSEHEGFCVPLLESFAAGVPVLAYGEAAVPETMGGAGVTFNPKDLDTPRNGSARWRMTTTSAHG